MTDRPLRYDERPDDATPVHTDELPATPTRDRNIVATAWIEAPAELLGLGDDLPGRPTATYKRRIGSWLLWRAGPASGGDARYWAADAADLHRQCTFRLFPDGTGEGAGPSGSTHARFRLWKEDLAGREIS
ncbi:MAG: hypothetical protein HZB15_03425 [Actinobacteria bacterium]|nr:hypothetical protein [Actinomycetota bacterium]